ncbi:RNA polymerase beta subunit, partial (plastid), partial [Olea europaea subsp. europaea]
VQRGKCIKKGQILADGATTVGGELALGKNVLVAYMLWKGYNSEDAVLISERLRPCRTLCGSPLHMALEISYSGSMMLSTMDVEGTLEQPSTDYMTRIKSLQCFASAISELVNENVIYIASFCGNVDYMFLISEKVYC